MLQPISFETEKLQIHSFHITDIENQQALAADVLSILSDPFTLTFVPEKRLQDIESAQDFIKTMIINHYVGRNHLHFITSKEMGRVIGLVDIISPTVAKEYYTLDDYPYFIEFYLIELLSGRSIMTEVLPRIIKELHGTGITRIAAAVNRTNKAAVKVLERSGFKFQYRFDVLQDLYLASNSV